MLPRRLRLSRRTFPLRAGGVRVRGAHFLVSLTASPEGKGGSAAIVSKKVARLSVTRHRLKRRMLSVMCEFSRPDRALVVTALSGSSLLPFSTLKSELRGLLERVFATL